MPIVAAADAPATERAEFIRKTYIHLGGAVLAFVAVAWALVTSPAAPKMMEWMVGGQYNWLFVLGGFMGVSWLAERWAQSGTSQGMQYLGLGLYVVAQAVLFVPMLYIAAYFTDPTVLPTAGIITALMFAGLTGTVAITGKDFSFLGKFLMFAGFGALGLIVASILFGFTLGLLFSFVMVAFASASILYQTSNIMHHYPVGAHVAAALSLFASVALLFWYILRIVMALQSRD
jgi:FtsH-binding integral membrane protein